MLVKQPRGPDSSRFRTESSAEPSVDKVRAAKMELLPLPESTTRKRVLEDAVWLEAQWTWSLVVLGLLVT